MPTPLKITLAICATAIVLALLARGHSVSIVVTHRVEFIGLTKHK